MTKKVHVLFIEDSEPDAALQLRELRRGGYEVTSERVDTEEGMAAALARRKPDIILSDYTMPEFTAAAALAHLRMRDIDIPLIIASGTIGEEIAVDLIRAGAKDFVPKDRFTRLLPTVERELREAAGRAERRRIEAALGATTERFRVIFESVSDGIFAVDPQTRAIIEVNRPGCSKFGYGRDDMVGLAVATLYAAPPSEPGPGIEEIFARVLAGTPEIFEWPCRTRSGALLWTETSLRFTIFGTESVFLATVRDISGRKAMEERRRLLEAQLHQAQKMEAVGQLTGGLAHDFNNLLGVILGNLDFLDEKFAPASDESELVRSAMKAADQGARLTRQLLAFARRQPLAPTLTDLGKVLEGTAELFRHSLRENIAVKMEVSPGLWPVLIDVAQFESAMLNLAVNARDAMPDGGTLSIEARNMTLDEDSLHFVAGAQAGDYVVVSTSDTGTGMPPEVIAKAFDPFFTTKGRMGTGLGLSMVHGFVIQSGGVTRIYSEVGKGTSIRIFLPRAIGSVSAADAKATAPSAARGNEVILVVEDNEELREVATRRLRELGYRTIPAGDAQAALDIIRGGAPIDLLFTDVVMPGGVDGWTLVDVARRLRPELKAVMTSGYVPDGGAERPGTSLLTKPYRKEDLARHVRAALQTPS